MGGVCRHRSKHSEKAAKLVSGKTLRAIPDFSKAKRVLSLDAISVNADASIGFARDFVKTRKVKDSKDASKMSRLYSVESSLTSMVHGRSPPPFKQ